MIGSKNAGTDTFIMVRITSAINLLNAICFCFCSIHAPTSEEMKEKIIKTTLDDSGMHPFLYGCVQRIAD